jgi:HEAT repeat protein
LLDAMRAPEPGVREMAASMLGQLRVPGTRAALIVALGDGDARVRAVSLRAIAISDEGLGELDLVPFAADPSPIVRAAALVSQTRDGITAASSLLADPSPHVRAAAIASLADRHETTGHIATLAALDDGAGMVRDAAATALATYAVGGDDLVDVLRDGRPRAQRAALVALVGVAERDPSVRARVADWTLQRLTRAAALRDARAEVHPARDGSAATGRPVAALLDSVLATRQRALEDLALGALAVLGSPEAGGVIRRCLRSDDIEIRAQALEALDSIADRRLASAFLRLLEGDAEAVARPGGSAEPNLRRLAEDADPWISALARRCIDDDGGGGGPDMAGSERTLTDLDTMLLLRRVPLFEGLDPEDLQRIAATSVERTFADGETLMREGDLGDELVVIVTGSVRVVRQEADGGERLIRRYEAGDHIGELAVLRERPRAATVLAEGELRGLVIGGDALKSILRERPEAAMAMLATLAERISRQ